MSPSAITTREPRWVHNAALFWARRRTLIRVGITALVLGTIVAFTIPKEYESTARILPPHQTSGGVAMLAALVGRTGATAGLGSLAGLMGGHSTGALYVNLLHSDTVAQRIIERFHLQQVYRKRYVVDTAKKLARRTKVTEDAKSGVITIAVDDNDRTRARDVAQAYVDELNQLVAAVNTSSAHREREFIEQRLATVKGALQQAEFRLSAFSTQYGALDIKEQTRASVEASARLQAQLIVTEGELNSLHEIYGRDNVRVRAAQARLGTLQHELDRTNGSLVAPVSPTEDGRFRLPAISSLPTLSVTWANLYRDVRIQETVFEMLSAQYETARIEEAKSIPSASIVDRPEIPEKKHSPHRLWIILLATTVSFIAASLLLIFEEHWSEFDDTDTRKILAGQITTACKTRLRALRRAQ